MTLRVHLLVVMLIIGIVAIPILPRAHAAAGSYFDNVVVVAMENQNYVNVMGTGTGATNAPFIASMLRAGATVPLYHGYGAAGRTVSGCSAGCYTALISGSDQGISDGYNCCINAPTLMDRMVGAALTWSAFCEDGCPRGNDHFPFTGFASISNSPNIHGSTGPLDPEFVAAMNSASPANFIWLTPTDSHNMHDNSIQTGDSYLHNLLVGTSGTLANPAAGSVLASNLFAPGHRTMLILWWDEYDPAPLMFYGPGLVKQAYISSSNVYDEFSILHALENNWALPTLTANDAAALPTTEIFGPSGPQPLSTSFTVSPSTPVMNLPVTFTAITTGGKLPYAVSWNFGDGSTGTGAIATHTYTSAQSFTIKETATDSSSPQQSAVSSQTFTAVSSLTGNFGVCANLPQGWNCGNLHPSAPSPSSAQIVTGVFQSRQSNPGLGGSNDYYYSTTQKGTFPWTPCSAPAAGVLPLGTTSVSVNFTSLSYNPGSSPSSDRYHIYIALYYWLPNGAVSAGGSSYRCLDTQVRVENIGGTFSPIGSTATYNPGDSFGWDNVTLQTSPGQTGILVADVSNQCLQDLKAWGLPTNTPCQLAGIEIGTEGYQFQELDVNWYDVSLNVGPIPLSTGFTVLPSNPIVNMPVTFTASTLGGTSPYSVSWNFGDGSTGIGASIVHSFTSSSSFTVIETATDSSSPSQKAISSKTVTVQPIPPLVTSFSFLPTTPLVNSPVTFTSVTTGGTPPYTIIWNFGDGSTGTGAATAHSYATAGPFTVTETATDASVPTKTATTSHSVTIYTSLPLSITSVQASPYSPQVGQSVTFTTLATGGTSPYTYTIAFGDGGTGSANPTTHSYSAPGSYAANVTVKDSASPQASASRSITVSVQALVPPVLTVPANQTVTAGNWINFTVTATAVNTGGTIALSTTGLPTGANFNQTTGLFYWKPSSTQTGSYTITFIATDSSNPSTPTSKPMGIQVNQAAAPGGSNGGNGGSGGGSNGGCTLCIPRVSPTIELLAVGGLLGLVSALAALTIKARASLERTKRRLRN